MARTYSLLAVAVLFTAVVCGSQISPHNLWPMPMSYEYGTETLSFNKACDFTPQISTGQIEPLVEEMLEMYAGFIEKTGTYGIERAEGNIPFVITIEEGKEILMHLDTDESYDLSVNSDGVTLSSKTFVGFLRGLETFSQLITPVKDDDENVTGHQITHIPVNIHDAPRYPHRGLLVDTSRHFISTEVLKKIMDGMMFTKLNVFHWHMTDTDSFPIMMPSHPKMSQNGAFDSRQTYSHDDVMGLVVHAMKRGIRIIPELDSPAHLNSWAAAPEFKDLVSCLGAEGDASFVGQIDPTQDKSYELLQDLINDINAYFPWEVVHFGADEVVEDCWKTDAIESFMKDHQLDTFFDLFNYYVKREKTLLPDSKRAMYWSNPATAGLQFDEDDIIQYWGGAKDFSAVSKLYPNNSFVLSTSDAYYLDWGYGTPSGSAGAPFKTWKMIYDFDFEKNAEGVDILGLEVCEWGELHSDNVIFDRVFPRSAAMGEKAWSAKDNAYTSTNSTVNRLNAWTWRIIQRGIPSAPITSGRCEHNIDVCFPL